MRRSSARLARIAFAAAPFLLAAAGARAADTSVRPLPIDDALRAAEITQRVPIEFSPDGKWIAYTVQNPNRIAPTGDDRYSRIPKTGAGPEALGCDVWVADTQSGAAKNLTDGAGTSWGPTWSPDGSLLAFYSDRDGSTRAWAWESATGRVRRLSDAVVRTYFNFETARWSPGGKQLLVKIIPDGLTLDALRDKAFGTATKAARASEGGADRPTVVVLRSGGPAGNAEKSDKSDQSKNPSISAPAAPTDRVFAFRADLALIDPANGTIRRLTTGLHPRGYWFSPDGSEIAVTDLAGWTENTQQPIYNLYAVRIADGSVRTLGQKLTMAYGISVAWSPDGKSLAYIRAGQLAADQCVVIAASDGKEQAVGNAPHIDSDWQDTPPAWDTAGRNIYVAGEKAVFRIDRQSGHSTPVYEIADGDVLDIISRSEGGRFWSPDGGKSIYVSFRNGANKQSGVLKIDLASAKTRTLFEEESYLPRSRFGMDVSPDGKRVAYSTQSATAPEDIWIAGVDFAGRKRLTHVNPQLDGYVYGRTQVIEWNAGGGERLRGALLLPAGYEPGKKYPLIVNVYGGSSRSNSLFHFGLSGSGVENMQLFATRGFAMLLPDAPIDRSKHSPMAEIARTVLPGVDRAVEMGFADPERLGVMGHSYGGYSTLSLIVQTTRFHAAMASAGFSNLVSMYGELSGGESGAIGYLEKGQGDMGDTPWAVRDRYIANSPYFLLDKVATPLLIVHGSLDIPERADETFVALRRLGKEVAYARYDGEQHWEGTWGFANQKDYWERILAWFGEHIGAAAEGARR